MAERVKYSKKREANLWHAVDKEIMNFRIRVLRGDFVGLSANGQEEKISKQLSGLPDLVAHVYRRKLP